jgi:putative ABC transport system permease protein
VREVVRKAGPETFINQMQPMDTLVVQAQAQTRFSLLLIGVFSTIAALLAGVGLYGVLATSVRQRTAEIGVRLALGAGQGRVVVQIVADALRVIGTGMLAGWLVVVVVALHAAPRGTLDAPLLLGVPALLLAVAALACWIPARRATRIDPMAALRHE